MENKTPEYSVVARTRLYSKTGDDMKKVYFNNANNFEYLNSLIPDINPRNTPIIRIMTWNVRYYTNVEEESTIDNIADIIKKISPDILCLQETITGTSTLSPSIAIDIMTHLYDDYVKISACNVVPSWHNGIYGNQIIIKKNIIDLVRKNRAVSPLYDIQCIEEKCMFNQYAKTYEYPNPHNNIGFALDRDEIMLFKSGDETRCFIKISFIHFDIFCTHLDATNKNIRRRQLDELQSNMTRKSIIMGDMNIIDRHQYNNWINILNAEGNFEVAQQIETELDYIMRVNASIEDMDNLEIDYIKNTLKWKEYSDLNFNSKYIKPNFTSWTGTVVDYIFFYKFTPDNIYIFGEYVHFNNCSDHLPIIVDISDFNLYSSYDDNDKVEPAKWEKIMEAKQFDEILPEMYNGESLAAYDWFIDNKININAKPPYAWRDPQMTGNFYLSIGSRGLYVTRFSAAQYYGSTFQNGYINSQQIYDSINAGLKYSCVIFKINRNKYFNPAGEQIILNCGEFEPYNYKNDELVDIAMRPIATPIAKLTEKNYDPGSGINNKFTYGGTWICLDIKNILLIDPILIHDDENIRIVLDQMITSICNITPILCDNAIKIAIVLINSFQHINMLNLKRYNKKLIDPMFLDEKNTRLVNNRIGQSGYFMYSISDYLSNHSLNRAKTHDKKRKYSTHEISADGKYYKLYGLNKRAYHNIKNKTFKRS